MILIANQWLDGSKILLKYQCPIFVRRPFITFSLQQFARKVSNVHKDFYGIYKRPSLELFNEHCDKVIFETGLKKCWHKGLVGKVQRGKDFWEVYTENGEMFKSKNVVIAISVNEQLLIPTWAEELADNCPKRVHHIFDENMKDVSKLKAPIAIIGGGITAAHLAIKLSQQFPGNVSLIKRHPFRVHDFDSDPGWLGLKRQGPFSRVKDNRIRREQIKRARFKGSVPRDVLYAMKRLEAKEKLHIIDGEVTSYTIDKETLTLNVNSNSLQVRHVLLATGFLPTRPGHRWIERLIEEEHLTCAHCGYPIVNKALEWCPHLYVMGPLAELEMGPIARNISGARQAAERIVASL